MSGRAPVRLALPRLVSSRPVRTGTALVGAVLILLSAVLFAVSIRASAKSPGSLVARKSSLVWKGVATRRPKSDPPAKVQFELENVGGRPVRIASVTSACGCAKPVVHPELVAPGQVAVVEVVAMMIPFGEKVVRFEVRTDSPVKPDIPLTLTLVGSRDPPFLYLLEGEAVFRGEYSPEMSGEISVLTIEKGEQGRSPEIGIDLPFLKPTLVRVEESSYIEPGTILRRWKYRIEFKARPSSGSFTGILTARSPWDANETLSRSVIGQLRSGPRAFPSAITLDRSAQEPTSLLVVCSSPSGVLDVVTDPSSANPVFVKEQGGGSERKIHRFDVGLEKPRASIDLDTETRITFRERETHDELVVPVQIITKRRDPAPERR